MSSCECPEVKVGGQPAGSRNWSDSCPEHGVGTDWFQALDPKPFGYAAEADTTRAEWLDYLMQQERELIMDVCPKCGTAGCLEDKALDW